MSADLRGRGVVAVVAALVILLAGNLVGAALVLVWAHWSRTPLSELGLAKPEHPARTVALGVLLGAGLKFLLKALVLPALGISAVNQAYQYLVGNGPAAMRLLAYVVIGGGVGEEIIWRGFLFERIRHLWPGQGKAVAALVVSSVLFGLAHFLDQGLYGVVQSFITGLGFGAMYVATRQLWLSMVAHA